MCRRPPAELALKAAIMQPYFLPYIGYFQLIQAVDLFIVYDNIKYTKKGWINRNRMLQNGADVMFSLPLQAASDSLDIRERHLSAGPGRDKWLGQLTGAYRHAPYFAHTLPLLLQIARFDDNNLFSFLHHALLRTCAHLGIETPIRLSSSIDMDQALKGQEKVLALCQAVGAQRYINAIGGQELYVAEAFRTRGIKLQFIRSKAFEYAQAGAPFVPWLSIVDLLMFNPLDTVQACISTNYELI